MITYLYLAQIILAITIIVLVLIQAKDAGMGNMFGGGDMGVARTRRGSREDPVQRHDRRRHSFPVVVPYDR